MCCSEPSSHAEVLFLEFSLEKITSKFHASIVDNVPIKNKQLLTELLFLAQNNHNKQHNTNSME